MIPDPELVFLDELTTGLDPKARREVWAIIQGLKAGRIVAQGSPAELVAADGTKNLEESFLMYMDREGKAEEVC